MNSPDRIDPLIEHGPCTLSREGMLLIQEVDIYLEEQARPVITAVKKYGWMILEGLAKSGVAMGLPRPPKSH